MPKLARFSRAHSAFEAEDIGQNRVCRHLVQDLEDEPPAPGLLTVLFGNGKEQSHKKGVVDMEVVWTCRRKTGKPVSGQEGPTPCIPQAFWHTLIALL